MRCSILAVFDITSCECDGELCRNLTIKIKSMNTSSLGAWITAVIYAVVANVEAALPSICPKIVSRTTWGARVPVQISYTTVPVKYVIIHHTVTPMCSSEESCSELLTNMQNFHMDELEYDDIGYNFLVGGDGSIYEGVGWHKVGAHTRGYNTRSLALAFIGNFQRELPNDKQLKAAKDFLKCAVELGELDPRYKLLAARQVSSTQSPGLKLYQELRNWSHFATAP